MKYKKLVAPLSVMVGLLLCSVSAFCVDLLDDNSSKKEQPLVLDANSSEKELPISIDTNSSEKNASVETVFNERFVYFDRGLDDDDNFLLLKKVIEDAKKMGFNALVLNQEYIYARLSHKNSIIDKVKKRYGEIETLVHAAGMRLIVMHFNADVPAFVVQDADAGNRFYQKGRFDFSEANRADTNYVVKANEALVDSKEVRVNSKNILDGLYHFTAIKPNTEYKLTLNATTKNYTAKVLKVSVLDEDFSGENGKVLFGIQKYFRNIAQNQENANYTVYFNSLNHKNLHSAVKIFLEKEDNIIVNYIALTEVGYNKAVHVQREDTLPVLSAKDTNKTYILGQDYNLMDDKIELLSPAIKLEQSLTLRWYPRIDVSRFNGHETTADMCADESLFNAIMMDQYQAMKSVFNANVDGIAINDDEWREAGWNEKCKTLYEKEFLEANTSREFTGGDYIGISTKRMIDNLLVDENRSKVHAYVMSDMFDPNFNAKDPYMGVNNGAIGAIEYLPKDTTVFNWFPNPYEPGLRDKTQEDFLKSAKHFASYGIKQIIAGYHDDMNNLDANIDFYKEADKETQKSIVGFMFLIWHQPGKNATYDDMEKVVKRICQELPNKWPAEACK